jgi:hypothetical protein
VQGTTAAQRYLRYQMSCGKQMRAVLDATAQRAVYAWACLIGQRRGTVRRAQRRGVVRRAGSGVEDAVPVCTVLACVAAGEQCVGGPRFCAVSAPVELSASLSAGPWSAAQGTMKSEAGAGQGALACLACASCERQQALVVRAAGEKGCAPGASLEDLRARAQRRAVRCESCKRRG